MAPIQTTIVAYLAETDARAVDATRPATRSSTYAANTHDTHDTRRTRMPLEENPNLAHAATVHAQIPRAKVSREGDWTGASEAVSCRH